MPGSLTPIQPDPVERQQIARQGTETARSAADPGFFNSPTVLRCHIAAFAGLGGVPEEILYDRMKIAVIGEAAEGGIVYNRTLLDFASHYRFHPKACRPYRAKTKGKGSGRSATSARTSSSAERSATSTT
jgi:transposase